MYETSFHMTKLTFVLAADVCLSVVCGAHTKPAARSLSVYKSHVIERDSTKMTSLDPIDEKIGC